MLLGEHPGIGLLFTDIVMPGGMLGDELAKEARLLRPEAGPGVLVAAIGEALAGGRPERVPVDLDGAAGAVAAVRRLATKRR